MTCRLKPGSLTPTGSVIDVYGFERDDGPCFVPRFYGASTPFRRTGRAMALDAAGWRWLRDASRWPGIPPHQTDVCIIRIAR